jgi:serpin B
MVVLLPRRADGLPELEKHFVDNTLDFGMESLRSRSVQLYMPRFEIDSGVVRLVPALERLGVKRLFSPAQAELGGISQKPGLFINRVMHRAWIRVDEASTEAAAATLMTMVTGELPEERVSHPVLVRIDHPFLFLLRDRQTSTNLFIGRVTKPTPVVEEE